MHWLTINDFRGMRSNKFFIKDEKWTDEHSALSAEKEFHIKEIARKA